MRKTIKATLVASTLVLLSSLMPRSPAQQTGTQAQPDAAVPPPPPPAYTPRPKDAPPVEDTPAQREALARLEAKAEERNASRSQSLRRGRNSELQLPLRTKESIHSRQCSRRG